MSNVSKIFLKIATILSTICAAIILAISPVFFIFGFSNNIKDMLITAIDDGTITVEGNLASGDAASIATILQVMFVILAFVFVILGVCCLINAIICSKTRSNPTRKFYIACIVTGALSTDLSIVGGILGLIVLNKQKPNEVE